MTQLKKLANAFYSDAEPSSAVVGPARHSVDRYKKKHGGLWVGGSVIINSEGVSFSANAINRKMHNEIKDINIPYSSMQSIQYRFGWFTGIVEIQHQGGIFLFRCYGAKKLVSQLNAR